MWQNLFSGVVFVYYLPYMILKNQLMGQSKAKLIIEGVEVYFEKLPGENRWLIKARMYYSPEVQTRSLQDNLQTLDHVKISRGHLKAYPEEGFVVLYQETEALSGFILFKSTMKDFMSSYDFWRSVVDDMIKSDGVLLI